MKQTSFSFGETHWKHRYSHGGTLRQKRLGRKARPISTREPIHLVFKANREVVGSGFRNSKRFQILNQVIRKYSSRFHVKIDHFSINGDHLHFVLRAGKRTLFQSFLKVLAGQIAQRLLKEGLLKPVMKTSGGGLVKLWKYRPFTRVVRSWSAYKIVLNYVQLNEKEARGKIKYSKDRLRGLNPEEWDLLWS